MLGKLLTLSIIKLHRGDPIMKHGATKTTIREEIRMCRQCHGRDSKCTLCKGTGSLACELIVNIFPNRKSDD